MTVATVRSRLDERLFPPAPRGPRADWAFVVLLVSALVLGSVLQLLRLGWSTPLHSLWAEDGSIFLSNAVDHGLLHNVVTPYARYLVVVPRLIGQAAAVLPLHDAPAAIAILAALVTATSGLAVWFASAAHVENQFLRGALAIATVLVPVSGIETIATGANVAWYMLFASFWLLLWRPRSAGSVAFSALFILATCLSTVGVVLLAPVALLRASTIRDRRDALIVGVFALGILIQVPIALVNAQHVPGAAWSSDIFVAYAQRVVASGTVGFTVAVHLWKSAGWAMVGPLIAIVVGVLALGIARIDSRARWVALIACGTSLLMFVVSTYARGAASGMVWLTGTVSEGDARYAVVPALLVVSAAIVVADSIWRHNRDWRGLAAVTATCFVILVAVGTSFDRRDSVNRGTPAWDSTLAAARHQCVSTGATMAVMKISPPGWTMTLPCGEIPR